MTCWSWRIAWLLALLAGSAAYGAEELAARLSRAPDPQARVQQIDGDVQAEFAAALADYDAYVASNPHDVVGRLGRCRFIDEFAANYPYASFSDGIDQRSAECLDEVAARFAGHPEVQLARLQRLYGAELGNAAREALAGSYMRNWTAGQMARLYVVLAKSVDGDDHGQSIEYARKALVLDETSDVRVLLATRLVERGDRDEAIEVLTSPVDGHAPGDAWYLSAKMNLLAELSVRKPVLDLYSRLREQQRYDHIGAARALRKVGAVSQARDEFERQQQSGVSVPEVGSERFRFELEHGRAEDALAAYERWREHGWLQDPLAINRVALLWRDPWLPWQSRDLWGLAAALLLIGAIGVAAAMPIALVHYRGLVRRAVTGEPYPSLDPGTDGGRGQWTLLQAWWASFAFAAASILALYGAGPLGITQVNVLNTMSPWGMSWGLDASPVQFARMAMVEALLGIALLLPVVFVARRGHQNWWGSHWSIAKCVAVGALAGLAFRLPLLAVWGRLRSSLSADGTDDVLWQMLDAVREQFGVVSAFWMLAICAPVIEELLFRGVLLRAFAQHIRFGWANLVQAALFAALHMNLKAAPMLFLLGLCAGILARRSGGLLAPMVLHAMFNLIAGWLILG